MVQLMLIAALSYLIGSFYMTTGDSRRFLLDTTKGYFALLLAGFLLHSGLSYLFAASGVLAGHTKPVFHKFSGETTEAVAFGILFFMSPFYGIIMLAGFLLAKRFFNDYDNAVFASSFLLPSISTKFFKSDSYVIICIIIFTSIVVQFWPDFLEEKIKSSAVNRTATGMIILLLLVMFFLNKYVYKGFGIQRDIIRHGPHHFKYVAITFDDGPDPIYTPEILDILKEKNVVATFFLIGKHIEQYPELANRIVEEGHSIGNHTYSHKSIGPLTARAVYQEIIKAQEVMEGITGVRPTLFRPPRGVYSSHAGKVLKDNRYTLVLWDISAVDWAEFPAKNVVSNVLSKVKPGSIILFHDSGDLLTFSGGNRSATVNALPEIIDRLRSDGYEFVNVDQMIFLSELMETEY
jgi:peptidoglycan/xylan/chitin deacetylase (PgdA/CDA1 family)